MPDHTIPTGAKLDVLVVWAVGYYNKEWGYIGSDDLTHIIAAKAGYDSQEIVGDHEARNIQRAIKRVCESGLITFETDAGYRIAGPS